MLAAKIPGQHRQNPTIMSDSDTSLLFRCNDISPVPNHIQLHSNFVFPFRSLQNATLTRIVSHFLPQQFLTQNFLLTTNSLKVCPKKETRLQFFFYGLSLNARSRKPAFRCHLSKYIPASSNRNTSFLIAKLSSISISILWWKFSREQWLKLIDLR